MDAFGTVMLLDLNQLKYFPMQICTCRELGITLDKLALV